MTKKDNADNLEDEVRKTFITECHENLETAEECILTMEKQGSEPEQNALDELFRALHTIKGGAGFMGLTKVTEISHAMESIIGLLRDRALLLDETISESLLKGIDKLKMLLCTDGEYDSIDISSVVVLLTQLVPGTKPTSSDDPSETPKLSKTDEKDFLFNLTAYNLAEIEKRWQYLFECRINLLKECERNNLTPFQFLESITSIGQLIDSDIEKDSVGNLSEKTGDTMIFRFLIGTILEDSKLIIDGLKLSPLKANIHRISTLTENSPRETIPQSTIEETHKEVNSSATRKSPPEIPDSNESSDKSIARTDNPPREDKSERKSSATTIRIPLSLIEKLMNLASELVLIRNQNIQAIESRNFEILAGISQKLNMVTSDLQASIMQTRMQPMATVFNPFKRIIRNLAIKLGKEIDLEIIGGEVELDKNIIDTIGEPLTHLVRNAVDHAIELPEVRESLGKTPEGHIVLKAFHHAGQVIINVKDDGAGMDPKNIKAISLEKGLITQQQATTMSDDEAYNLIFAPGFSSAKIVTEVSGRGVGMDVVKESFHNLGGVVEIHSEAGHGTSVTVNLPLTLAIMPALIVDVENDYFAIPQVNIAEVVWLWGQDVYQQIETVCDQEVYRLRGRLLPILRLSKILNIQKTYADPVLKEKISDRRIEESDRRRNDTDTESDRRAGPVDRRTSILNSLYIVILKLGTEQFGLIIDNLIDTQEIVVKPIHEQLKSCQAFAGVTFLGDGSIAMILDIVNIAAIGAYNISSLEGNITRTKPRLASKDEVHVFLLFNIGGAETFAVPLWMVKRVDQANAKDIKTVNKKEYLHFNDGIIPLVRIEKAINAVEGNYGEHLYVIVPNFGKTIGILATEIIDAVETSIEIDEDTISEQCMIGSAIINGTLTVFLDIYTLIENADSELLRQLHKESAKGVIGLLVDDSPLHASLIASILRGKGVTITIARNGKEAIDALENPKNNRFDFVISDIEMPVMDGLELAKWIKKEDRFCNIPLIALTAGDENYFEPLAMRAGFNRFYSKLDREGMIGIVNKLALKEFEDIKENPLISSGTNSTTMSV